MPRRVVIGRAAVNYGNRANPDICPLSEAGFVSCAPCAGHAYGVQSSWAPAGCWLIHHTPPEWTRRPSTFASTGEVVTLAAQTAEPPRRPARRWFDPVAARRYPPIPMAQETGRSSREHTRWWSGTGRACVPGGIDDQSTVVASSASLPPSARGAARPSRPCHLTTVRARARGCRPRPREPAACAARPPRFVPARALSAGRCWAACCRYGVARTGCRRRWQGRGIGAAHGRHDPTRPNPLAHLRKRRFCPSCTAPARTSAVAYA